MRLAVLGTDSDILALVAATQKLGHEIVWLGDVRPADTAPLAALLPASMTPSDDWETLLDQATAEAVLIGRGTASDELRAEQLKRLATDAVPMLIVHPICDSVLTYYEVEMIRRETHALVQHYHPLILHPAVGELADWIRDPDGNQLPQIGPIQQVSCERSTPETSRAAALAYLARDTELIAALAGPIRGVSAVGPHVNDVSYASCQVQFSPAGPPSLRWSLTPQGAGNDGVRITLVGERGVATLHARQARVDERPLPWTIDVTRDSERAETTLGAFDAPIGAIQRLALALDQHDAALRAQHSTWEKATQAMEVVDAVELSLQKGRIIEVLQQQLTERLAFRGTMAALGCGLLLVALAVFIVAGLIGNAIGLAVIGPWPTIVLAVLAVFLLLQALPLIIPKRRAAKRGTADAHGDDRRSD